MKTKTISIGETGGRSERPKRKSLTGDYLSIKRMTVKLLIWVPRGNFVVNKELLVLTPFSSPYLSFSPSTESESRSGSSSA